VFAYQRGDVAGAVAHWQRAVAIAQQAGAVGWSAVYNLAIARDELGRWHAAVEDYRAALRIVERAAPGGSNSVARVATALGAVLLELGDVDAAAPYIERGLDASRASRDTTSDAPLMMATRLALARGDRATARQRLAEAFKLDGEDAALWVLKGELARADGGCGAARPLFEHAQELAKKGIYRSDEYDATVALAECQLELGASATAVAALQPLLRWREESGADAEASSRLRFALARALVHSGGDRVRARALATAARAGSFGVEHKAEIERWLGQQR
jgi:hypothetical protein